MSEISGYCEPAWEVVREKFVENFAEGDLGASACVIHGDQTVVDLWGGHRDVAAENLWERDTIVNV